jgi:hypothetical protein
MIIRDVLFVLACAAGALLAISQYIIMFSECVSPRACDKLGIAYSLGACEPSGRPRETPRRNRDTGLGAALFQPANRSAYPPNAPLGQHNATQPE